MLALSVKVLTM